MDIKILLIILVLGILSCISCLLISSALGGGYYYNIQSSSPIIPLTPKTPTNININLDPIPILSLNKTYYIAKIDQNTGHAYLYTADGKPVSTIIKDHTYFLMYYFNTAVKELNLYYLGNVSTPDPTKNTPTMSLNLPLYSYAKLMSFEDGVIISPSNIKTYINKGNKIILNGGYTKDGISDNRADVTTFIKSL